MIDLFKKVFWYTRIVLSHILRFISDVKKIHEELLRRDALNYVKFTPGHLKA